MIRKILFATLLLLAATAAQAQREIVRLTRYEGQTITGVRASHMFKVNLVESSETRAVVEIDADLERYLRFERRADGTVSVALDMQDDMWRHFSRGENWRRHTIRLTVYTPAIEAVELRDLARLSASGTFTGGRVEIDANDMSRLDGLNLRAETVSVELSGMASATLTLEAASVEAEADGMAKLHLGGAARRIHAEADEMAVITAEALRTERAEAQTDGMAKITVHAGEAFHGRSTGLSSVRYEGDPAEIDLETPTRTIRVNH